MDRPSPTGKQGFPAQSYSNQGKAAFVCHEWVGRRHPDADMRQFRVLQDAIRNLISGKAKVLVDMPTELSIGLTKAAESSELLSRMRRTCISGTTTSAARSLRGKTALGSHQRNLHFVQLSTASRHTLQSAMCFWRCAPPSEATRSRSF